MTLATSEAVLDIETCADIDPAMLAYLRGRIKPAKNIKDPAKIEADLLKREKAIIEKAALSPRTARVCIAGVALRMGKSDWQPQVLVDKTGNETELLRALDDLLADNRVTKLITYNGARFDLPFLAARAMRYSMALRFKWPVGRWHPLHTDMFDVLGDGSLEAWMIALFGQRKESSGAEIADLIDAGKWDEAANHCRDDVLYLAQIYDRYNAVTQGR